MKTTRVFVALVIAVTALVLGLIGTARSASAHSNMQGNDLIATTLAFADAYNAGDGARMRELADPAFEQVSGTGEALDLEGFIKTTNTGVRVTLSNCKLTRTNVVTCDTVLSGGPIPPLPHPWTEISMLTFANGKILRLDETLSDQTAQELQAFAGANSQAGMPSTGASDLSTPRLALFLGLLLVGVGALICGPIRRRGSAR